MKKSRVVTVFPKGTIVKFDGIPCELLNDVPYYSATFQKVAEDPESGSDEPKDAVRVS